MTLLEWLRRFWRGGGRDIDIGRPGEGWRRKGIVWPESHTLLEPSSEEIDEALVTEFVSTRRTIITDDWGNDWHMMPAGKVPNCS